jgi:hypothetical protein
MPRASSVLSLSVALALAASAYAVDPPVIINGTSVAKAQQPPAEKPADSKVQPPVIYNYPSAATNPPAEGKKSDMKLPTIVNQPPAVEPAKAPPAPRAVGYYVPYVTEYMAPVGYNAFGVGGPMLNAYGGYGYGGWGYGCYGYLAGGYLGGYGYDAYTGYAPALAMTPSILDLRPPRVEVLDTGVRANVGRLTSLPSVREPVWNPVVGVYYYR